MRFTIKTLCLKYHPDKASATTLTSEEVARDLLARAVAITVTEYCRVPHSQTVSECGMIMESQAPGLSRKDLQAASALPTHCLAVPAFQPQRIRFAAGTATINRER